ncbi:hypothetical protein LFL96_27245 [Paraburkholderia sp. D15]|uniref:tetratricopeptide repeat protein n=1 Tax=Paraburkholderia sp. D15 TaxID=2880218 RepID=UPI00247B11A8|nr:tetratricopeptide repeat protein [Paraburkholderia sp. D15]WGS54702.1 hypothetical protein LFL96_27245 [Paraburkholderia sp. D15]
MKWVIRVAFLWILFFCWVSAFAADSRISLFSRGTADAALLINEGKKTLLIAGGAPPGGGATSADCFVKVDVLSKKGDSYYEGKLSAVHNSIANLDERYVAGRHAGVYMFHQSIRVGGVQIGGLCADDIDFSGRYLELGKEDRRYREVFLYYAGMMHENAIYLIGINDFESAVRDLRPFADNYSSDWLDSKEGREVLVPLIGDYGFAAQSLGDDTRAVSVFEKIVKIDPKRVVTWLNLADSYWNLGVLAKAKDAYGRYISMMNARGLMSQIPPRAYSRTAGD